MSVENEQPFPGGARGVITAVVVGDATLQAKGADGSWVNVPDGNVGDTVYSFFAPTGSVWRFTGMTGSVEIFS
jgi:hypothetical protein